jgi:hypothetical protein
MSFWNSLPAVTYAAWLSGLFAVLLTVTTFVFSERKGTLNDTANAEANSKRDSETQAAKERAANAEKEAAKANEHTAQLEKEAAGLRLEQEHLRTQQSARRVTENQANAASMLLVGAPRGKIRFNVQAGDPESIAFATQLVVLFRKNAFQVEDVSPMVAFGPLPTEEIIAMRSSTEPPAHAGAVQQALETVGIKAPAVVNEGIPEDLVEVFVVSRGFR